MNSGRMKMNSIEKKSLFDRFCRFHGENRPQIQTVPRDLICCAEFLIPHLLKTFIRALRMGTVSGKE